MAAAFKDTVVDMQGTVGNPTASEVSLGTTFIHSCYTKDIALTFGTSAAACKDHVAGRATNYSMDFSMFQI